MKNQIFTRLRAHLEADELVALVSVIDGDAGDGAGSQRLVRPGGETHGHLGHPALDHAADELAQESFRTFVSQRRAVEIDARRIDLFCEVHPPAPKLILVGAVHVAIHLARFAAELGFKTTVIDPRSAFATPERFSHVDELVARWPQEVLAERRLDEATCLATLAHDPKIDLPALEAALRSPARYIGALGSKRTHAKRLASLRESGFTDAELERIHAPIGLDLGGRRAEEIALAVMAEIVAVTHGK